MLSSTTELLKCAMKPTALFDILFAACFDIIVSVDIVVQPLFLFNAI